MLFLKWIPWVWRCFQIHVSICGIKPSMIKTNRDYLWLWIKVNVMLFTYIHSHNNYDIHLKKKKERKKKVGIWNSLHCIHWNIPHIHKSQMDMDVTSDTSACNLEGRYFQDPFQVYLKSEPPVDCCSLPSVVQWLKQRNVQHSQRGRSKGDRFGWTR